MKTLAGAVAMISCSTLFAGTITGEVNGQRGVSPRFAQAVVWVEGDVKKETPRAHVKVAQSKMAFVPAMIAVVAGQTVDFPNEDSTVHHVYSLSPAKKFNLGFFEKGQSKSVTFDTLGEVDVHCYLHRPMNAKIFVVPNRYFAVVPLGNSFTIPDVPAGNYKLHVWHPELGTGSLAIKVAGVGKTKVVLSPSK